MSLTEQSAPSVRDFMDDPIGFFGRVTDPDAQHSSR